MTKKIIACFVAALIILIPLQTNAEELQGTVTSLSLDEKAPYAGVLLDPIAASKMLVDQRYLRIEIELQLRKEFQKDLSEKRMAFDLLKIDYESLKKMHEDILLVKENQIKDLNLFLKEEISDDHSAWWVLGGAAIGIVLSIAVFYASVEVVKQ
tara:strand:+ start:305 stop:766 length:462 start_codon:yes stop_codon:yes gene_type:complete